MDTKATYFKPNIDINLENQPILVFCGAAHEIMQKFFERYHYYLPGNSILLINNPGFLNQQYLQYDISNISVISADVIRQRQFDILLGTLLGVECLSTEDKKIKILFEFFPEICNSLNHNGVALFLVSPDLFNSKIGKYLLSKLNNKGIFIHALFNTPIYMLGEHSNPLVVAMFRNEPQQLFVADLVEINQALEVVDNFFSLKGGETIFDGIFLKPENFSGMLQLKISIQIKKLDTQYKNYTFKNLEDFIVEINNKQSINNYDEQVNCVYIPKTSRSPVITSSSKVQFKESEILEQIYGKNTIQKSHEEYFQVVLNDCINNEYLRAYLNSNLGKLVLDACYPETGGRVKTIELLKKAKIALPPLSEQMIIVKSQNTLEKLSEKIQELSSELAINPQKSSSIQNQMEDMLEVISGLNDEQLIKKLIREGESKRAEFKSTLSLDLKTRRSSRDLETSSLKTIIGFLNSEGGILLIGIADHGEITGVEEEIDTFYKNVDKFLLHWKDLLKSRIGEELYSFIDYRFVKADDKKILLVECKPSTKPCFLDSKDFYVRTNPATDKLEGPQLIEYLKTRFPTIEKS